MFQIVTLHFEYVRMPLISNITNDVVITRYFYKKFTTLCESLTQKCELTFIG